MGRLVPSIDARVVAAARDAFAPRGPALKLGAVVHGGVCQPEPLVTLPLAMVNRHGLVAGATGTGKTKTLQVMAEQLSSAGVPVFLVDLKGDLSGMAASGEASERVRARAAETGFAWAPAAVPIELLSLSGRLGAQVRSTVSSFGPLLLAKVLELNDTQAGVLALVFRYCDDKGLLLLDLPDLRAVLEHLAGAGQAELAGYGGLSKATAGVLLRELLALGEQGADLFFGEPEFELDDLFATREGRGVVTILELRDVQDRPALFSTAVMWLLARLYDELPEVGDLERPKLVFFFDEAHLLFRDASKAFLAKVEQVVRLVRSKGVGVFFVTQSPKDVPPGVLGQLGHRVQHALRAFTPDDEKALRAAARTFPKTDFYDIEETLTTLGIGEALVTVLGPTGVPTPPFATRLVPPASRMGPLDEAELASRLAASPQVRRYAQAIDRESARERLSARVAPAATSPAPSAPPAPRRRGEEPPSTFEQILRSPVTRTVAGALTRGVLDALLGRRRRS